MNGKRVNQKWSFVLLSLMISAGLFWLLSTTLQSPPVARVMAAPDAPLAPSPTSFVPEPNSHYAPRNAPVTVNFDEAIDAATVTSHTFAVFGSQSPRVTGTYSLSNLLRTVTLHPAREYFPGELIHATVTTGTQNITGEQALSAAVWQFRAAVGLGSGLFAEGDSQMSPTLSRDVVLGDMDNDSDLDALLVNTTGDNMILHNSGGILELFHNLPTGASSSSAGALGDVDGDGDLDAFVATSDGVELWENSGSGTFTNPQYLGMMFSYDIALGDVDADGDLDALVVEGMNTRVWVNQDQASGIFSDTLPALTQVSEPMEAVALGDLDNDGDLDAYQVRLSGSGDEVWLNDGTGLFSNSGQSLDMWDSEDVALGDLDGDDDLDAFVVNSLSQGNTVWFNTGSASGIFTDSGQSLGFAESYAVSLGDVDGDGDLDAFVANAGVSERSDVVYINDGAGYFT
ncbi:MAG: FG-GAP-like repeat-containing protein, partial [Anaerolineae bacterium]